MHDQTNDRAKPEDQPERPENLDRRAALARLGKYAQAGYVAPAVLSMLVSQKASAYSPVGPG